MNYDAYQVSLESSPKEVFEQRRSDKNGALLKVDLFFLVQLVPDLPHGARVRRSPENPDRGGAFLQQLQQQHLEEGKEQKLDRFKLKF